MRTGFCSISVSAVNSAKASTSVAVKVMAAIATAAHAKRLLLPPSPRLAMPTTRATTASGTPTRGAGTSRIAPATAAVRAPVAVPLALAGPHPRPADVHRRSDARLQSADTLGNGRSGGAGRDRFDRTEVVERAAHLLWGPIRGCDVGQMLADGRHRLNVFTPVASCQGPVKVSQVGLGHRMPVHGDPPSIRRRSAIRRARRAHPR